MTDQNSTAEQQPSNPSILTDLAAAGVTPQAVAAASQQSPAPADPQASGIQALEQRVAEVEAQISAVEKVIAEVEAWFAELKAHFGGKIG